MFQVVQDVAATVGNLNNASCGTWLFMDRLVDTLRTYDTRWGYNWKRGNVGDPSLDVIAYHWGAGADEGSIIHVGAKATSKPPPSCRASRCAARATAGSLPQICPTSPSRRRSTPSSPPASTA